MTSASSLRQPVGGADFGRTRWSVVAAVRGGDEDAARRSLAELCRRYWAPVYAYVRASGQPPVAAAGVVQAFLGRLVQEIRTGDPAADGGFRAFLQRRLAQFTAGDWAGVEPGDADPRFAPPWPLQQIEDRQGRELLRGEAPAEAFQRAFALELLALGLQQLREEAEQVQRGAMFDALRPYLTCEPTPDQHAALARTLGCSPLAATIAVRRLRQRFQELIDGQLAQTVGGPDAFEAERAALLGLLAGPARR